MTNWDDLKELFEIVYNVPLNEKNSYVMTRNLREFMKTLIAGTLSLSPTENKKWKDKISTYLKDAKSKNPYEELPDQEREILQSIDTYLSDQKYQEVKSEIKNLSVLMIAKQSKIDKHIKTNKWSFPCAIFGMILTLVFGILSFVLA